MTTYYVRTSGDDSAAGTSAATAWLTLAKAMGTAGAGDGDIVYVGGGTYRSSATITPATHTSMTYLYGDTDGSKTGDAGEVLVTTFATNDTTAAANVHVFTFSSKNYWTLGKLSIMSGNAKAAIYVSGSSANLTVQDCSIWSWGWGLWHDSPTFGTTANITFKRCRMLCRYGTLQFSLVTSASGSDNNLNVLIENCIVMGNQTALQVDVSGTSTYRQGGIVAKNSIFYAGLRAVTSTTAYLSTTSKLSVYNSVLMASDYAIYNTSANGAVVEDYNFLSGVTGARLNVTAGSNSVADGSKMWRISQGHEASFGGVTRPWGEFPAASPYLTFGGTVVPTDDINGVTRPASGASQGTAQQALGPFERSNSATKETTTTRTGGTAIKIAGPGYHDFELAVSPTSTSVSVWSYKDATYGTAATGPQLIITNGGEAGVAGTTITSTGGTGAWAAMTATFTPTSAGIVTVRLQSNATAGSAAAYFDDFGVA